jgi:histidyl-tRNA synthetase
MVAARRQELAYPARLYSIANFMRYERPQRGREREFWQLNVDLFGVDDITADVEVITIADSILKAFGAGQDDYVIRVNNRKFIHFMMARYLGLDIVAAGQMTKLFDRRGKITEQDFEEQVTLILGDEAVEQIPKIKQVIDAKTIDELPAELQASPSLDEIKAVFVGLKKQNVTNAIFDATLMRGLDYYTGTVFEAFDTHPDNNRSLFGGGRYDGLVGLFGAEPLSAVGMAPGNTMIENFLTVHNLLPEDQSLTQVYVVVIGTALDGALEVATKLRKAGIKTEVDITSRKLDKQMKTALKKLIPNILFIGESEVEMGEYTLKNLASETEEKLTVQQIVDKFA